MSKHTKLKPPRPSKAADNAGDAFAQLDELYARVIGGVDKLLGSIETTIESGTASPALAREAANLVRALNGISAEQRAREKQRRAAFQAIDTTLVAEWFRTLDRTERTRFIQQLEGADRTVRSGLA